jgi:hypothetical protein
MNNGVLSRLTASAGFGALGSVGRTALLPLLAAVLAASVTPYDPVPDLQDVSTMEERTGAVALIA